MLCILQGYFTGYPKHVFFILGNEFCERFSFYGMKGKLFFQKKLLKIIVICLRIRPYRVQACITPSSLSLLQYQIRLCYFYFIGYWWYLVLPYSSHFGDLPEPSPELQWGFCYSHLPWLQHGLLLYAHIWGNVGWWSHWKIQVKLFS